MFDRVQWTYYRPGWPDVTRGMCDGVNNNAFSIGRDTPTHIYGYALNTQLAPHLTLVTELPYAQLSLHSKASKKCTSLMAHQACQTRHRLMKLLEVQALFYLHTYSS